MCVHVQLASELGGMGMLELKQIIGAFQQGMPLATFCSKIEEFFGPARWVGLVSTALTGRD